MNLQILWFCLIAVFWSGYLVLEGFDFGVGMLLPFLPRDEEERSEMFRSIGPIWDGNEVWLVVAGAATFAAFPDWYATMFSGFYLALLLVLFLLIIRVVSFEWRDKSESPRWRRVWLWANAAGSAGIALVWGIALANLIHGVPIDSGGDYTGNFWDLFSVYTVLGGVAFLLLFVFHGAGYLTQRSCLRDDGPRHGRRRRDALHRSLPARDGVELELRQQPDRLERGLAALHAGRDYGGRPRARAARPPLSGLVVLRLSRARQRRGGTAPGRRGRPADGRPRLRLTVMRLLDERLLRRAVAARRLPVVDSLLGVAGAVLVVLQAVLIARIVTRAFHGAPPRAVAPELVVLALTFAAR